MNIAMINKFNYFLNTVEGNLFLNALQLTILLIFTYMLVSEYLRTKEEDLRFLFTAFSLLSLQKLLLVIILFFRVFGKVVLAFLIPFIPLVDNGIESLALGLLAIGFILPTIRKKRRAHLNSFCMNCLLLLGIVVAFFEIIWYFLLVSNNDLLFNQHWINTSFVLINTLILITPIIYFSSKKMKKVTYRTSIIGAFAAYLIVPLLELINITFYQNTFSHISVAATPFPFVAILLFARVAYLRLVDKASLLQQLKESKRKYTAAKQVSKLKDEFISVVSHELRTPLTSMKLHTSLLKEGRFGKLQNNQEEAINTIHEEINRLTNLVNDTLDMSRLESGKAKMRVEAFDISEMIAKDSHYAMAEEKGIRIVKKCPKNYSVVADKEKIRQVFINLLSNAIKFTEKGGTIKVTVKNKPKHWQLIVADTGKGIPKKKLPRLFNKFYQADDYMTRKSSGTGLGLSIVKKIVQMHKGKIQVTSTVGKGSTFTLTFPKKN